MDVQDTPPSQGTYVTLTDGRYASGNCQYGSGKYVLMSDGGQVSGLKRLNPIEQNSINVSNGHLTWKYKAASNVNEGNFKQKISFTVLDDDGNEIFGNFEVSVEDGEQNIYNILFTEDQGAMKAGEYNISVVTICGTNPNQTTLKSFARQSENKIIKLATIVADDYEISADNTNSTETLSLEKYFQKDGNEQNTVTGVFTVGEQTYTVVFSETSYKIYILRDENTQITYTDGDGYVHIQSGSRIVIADDSHASVHFTVTMQSAVTSDQSQDFVLQRSSWGEDAKIHWDSKKGEFTWNFELRSLNSPASATEIKYVTASSVELYEDSELNSNTEIFIQENTEIKILQILQKSVQIEYEDAQYYVSREQINCTEKTDENGDNIVKVVQPTDLFKIFDEKNGEKIILLDEKFYKLSAETSGKIVSAEFVVEVTYGTGESAVTRIYTTDKQSFTPTIIGRVSISIRIKLNSSSLQSVQLSDLEGDGVQTDDEGQYVDFNLFASGRGTQQSPYGISNETQFLNIAYRQTKDKSLNSFTEQGKEGEQEDEKYYFKISSNLELREFSGILFGGEFSGEIDASNGENGNFCITYTSSGVCRPGDIAEVTVLPRDSAVTVGNNASNIVYTTGSALFEKLTSSAEIKNLDLDVRYKDGIVATNSILAGLAVTNNGKISDVNLTGFSTSLRAQNVEMDTKVVLAYSGLVGINSGSATISNCNVKTSMEFADNAISHMIFVGGIAYTNHATIASCVCGEQNAEQQQISIISTATLSKFQVAGITVTNKGTTQNCTNYSNISVEGPKSNLSECFVAGIMCLNVDSQTNGNINYGTLSVTNIDSTTKTDEGIWATTKAASV